MSKVELNLSLNIPARRPVMSVPKFSSNYTATENHPDESFLSCPAGPDDEAGS